MADGYLVEAGFGVDADPEEAASARCKVVDGLVTSGNGKTIGKGNGIEASVVDAKAPDEILDVSDVLLVRLWGEDDHREPASEVGKVTDPSQLEEFVQLGFHNFRFVHTVSDRPAGDWIGGASVDAEFIVEDWSVDAGGSE